VGLARLIWQIRRTTSAESRPPAGVGERNDPTAHVVTDGPAEERVRKQQVQVRVDMAEQETGGAR
jgi:hypothetical protein